MCELAHTDNDCHHLQLGIPYSRVRAMNKLIRYSLAIVIMLACAAPTSAGEFGIDIVGYVVRIGDVAANIQAGVPLDQLRAIRDANEAYCPNAKAAENMIAAIEQAKVSKETVGCVV